MLTIALALAAAVVPAAPSAEAEALGAQLARLGAAATILPMMVAKDTDELVAQHPELGDADKAALRATAGRVAQADLDRLYAALGHAYAAVLSVADLRAVVAFEQSPAAMRYRAAVPQAMVRGMQALGQIDFKQDALRAYCAETGKACPPR